MVYHSLTLTIITGKRFQAIAHVQKLAQLLAEKYGAPAEVLGNGTGLAYQCHLVGKYKNMAHLDESNKALMADPAFDAWWEASVGLVEWQDARTTIYEVLA